jgi:hypothetical protein
MLNTFLNYISQSWNEWLNSERQEKIISFQVLTFLVILALIYFLYNKHIETIFELNNFIEQGQELKKAERFSASNSESKKDQ